MVYLFPRDLILEGYSGPNAGTSPSRGWISYVTLVLQEGKWEKRFRLVGGGSIRVYNLIRGKVGWIAAAESINLHENTAS